MGTCPCVGLQSEETLTQKCSIGVSKEKGICHPMCCKLSRFFIHLYFIARQGGNTVRRACPQAHNNTLMMAFLEH